jgi:hypothetical protein
MIPTIVVERRLKEEITVPGDTEAPQMKVTGKSKSTDVVAGGTPPHLHHLLLTERKSTARDTHPPPHHLKRESTRSDIDTRPLPEVRGGEETTRGRDARGTVEMRKGATNRDHIDIIRMTHRIRVQVRHRLKLRKRKGKRYPDPEVGQRKMTKNENIKKNE